MLILIGPFKYDKYIRKTKRMRVIYIDQYGYDVPTIYLDLDLNRIYEAYYVKDGNQVKEYFLYDTDKIDFYQNYTTVLPADAIKRNEMVFTHYECPDGTIINDFEAGEWLEAEGYVPCDVEKFNETGEAETRAEEKIDYVWKPKPIPSNAKIIAGDNKPEVIIPKLFGNVSRGNAIILKILSKKTVEYENKKINVVDGIGYVYGNVPADNNEVKRGIVDLGEIEVYGMDNYYAYKVLKSFSFDDIEKNIDAFDITDKKLNEVKKQGELPDGWYVTLAKDELKELGKYIIRKFKDIDEKRKIDLIEKISKHDLSVLAEVLPEKYAEEYALSEISKYPEKTLMFTYPDDVKRFRDQLEKYLSEQTKQKLSDIQKDLEERWKRYREEEERQRREMLEKKRQQEELEKQLEKEEKERKIKLLKQIMKQVNEEFRREGINAKVRMEEYLDMAKIEAKTTSYMNRSDFDRYIEILKDYGFSYNPRNKTWSIDIRDINNGFKPRKKLKI